MQNAKSIAESLKLKAQVEKKKNTMKVFAMALCETSKDKNGKIEYFRMTHRKNIRLAQEREKYDLKKQEEVENPSASTNDPKDSTDLLAVHLTFNNKFHSAQLQKRWIRKNGFPCLFFTFLKSYPICTY